MYLTRKIMFDRGCSRRSLVAAHAQACPTHRPCPPVAFLVVGFSFERPSDGTQRPAFRIPRLSAWRSPDSASSLLIKNARATALIRAHCAISFALCSNELFLQRLAVLEPSFLLCVIGTRHQGACNENYSCNSRPNSPRRWPSSG